MSVCSKMCVSEFLEVRENAKRMEPFGMHANLRLIVVFSDSQYEVD